MMIRRSSMSARLLCRAVAPCWRNLVSIRAKPHFVAPLLNLRYNSSTTNDKSATLKVDNPQLMIAFTCKKCNTRSSHTFSRQAYFTGSVLIQCPGCKGRHLIADNLKIFADNNFNLEEYLQKSGENVKTDTQDLVFEDIPESLRSTLGHYAKDAPEEHQKPEISDNGLPSAGKKDT